MLTCLSSYSYASCSSAFRAPSLSFECHCLFSVMRSTGAYAEVKSLGNFLCFLSFFVYWLSGLYLPLYLVFIDDGKCNDFPSLNSKLIYVNLCTILIEFTVKKTREKYCNAYTVHFFLLKYSCYSYQMILVSATI